MGERLTSLLQKPSRAAIGGLAGSALLLNVLAGCSNDNDPSPPKHNFSAGPDAECDGSPQYILSTPESTIAPYVKIHLKNPQGEKIKADEIELVGLDTPFEHTGTPKGKYNRIPVSIPLDVAHVGVSALKNGVRYSCLSLEYPNKQLSENR